MLHIAVWSASFQRATVNTSPVKGKHFGHVCASVPLSVSLPFNLCFSAFQTAAGPPVTKLVSEACQVMSVTLFLITMCLVLFASYHGYHII